MARTVLAFGELLWDVFPNGEVLGGAPANFCYRINSLGHEGRLVTRLGEDDRGRRAADLVGANGMSLKYVQWDDKHPTGTVPVELEATGSPNFTILPNVAYDHIETTAELLALATRADCICFGTLIQRAETSRRTLHALLDAAPRALKVLDLNLRKDCYTPETIAASLERADILKLNESEAEILAWMFGLPDRFASFAPAAVKQWNLTACVVTLGAKGVVAANHKGEFVQRPGHKVNAVDTVGAGDAFTAGFLHCHFEDRSLDACCDFANALGALVSETRGGTAPIKLEAIEALSGGKRRADE
ncbi:MAG TPA: carbohydrate kinase [Verrucomicrobiae bacterium]|nr:carbohydrate kinase [Verrucomicrobiae bacterium]